MKGAARIFAGSIAIWLAMVAFHPECARAQAGAAFAKTDDVRAADSYQDIYIKLSAAGPSHDADLAEGQWGLALAAAGDTQRAFTVLNDSAAKALAGKSYDVAATSGFNATLLNARLRDITPSNLLWLPRLRGTAFPAVDASGAQAILDGAKSAYQVAPGAGISARGRVLYVNYAYGAVGDTRLVKLLGEAIATAQAAGDDDALLAAADAAIGRLALRPDSASRRDYQRLAYDALTPGMGRDDDQAVQSRAMGLMGRLYGLGGDTVDAVALTGEAALLARKAGDAGLQLEFGTQFAALLEASGQTQAAADAYSQLVGLVSSLQPVLRSQVNIEQRTALRQLMAMALLAQVDLTFRLDRHDETRLRLAQTSLELTKVIDIEAYFGSPCLKKWTQDSRDIDSAESHTAVIYPVSFDTRTEVLVAIAGHMAVYRAGQDMGEADMETQAGALRTALQAPGGASAAPGQALYAQLLAPEADALAAAGIDTLIFVPGQALRGVALDALSDGHTYVGQAYAVATALSLTLVDGTPVDRRHPVALVAGLTHSGESGDLPFVAGELKAISAVVPGQTVTDAAFTVPGLKAAAGRLQPTVLHIASHGHFGARVTDNFVETAGDPLTSGDFTQLFAGDDGSGIDLLTLSACNTARGSGDAMLGLAGLAYQAGARSVVGSLWKADDRSAGLVFAGFYRRVFREGKGIAQALHAAQLDILNDPATRDPYYWAGYVVIGNWQ